MACSRDAQQASSRNIRARCSVVDWGVFGDRCLGFYFRCFVPGARGRPVEAPFGSEFDAASDRFLERLRHMLRGRPDLLDKLGCLEFELEVQLHCGRGFYDEEDHTYFYGRVDPAGEHIVLQIATDEVLGGTREGNEALDVVIHELTHVLDLLEEPPGMLPFWDEASAVRFIELRDVEIVEIEQGRSRLDPYALNNEVEFLAVAVETYFAAEASFRTDCPEIAGLFDNYFGLA